MVEQDKYESNDMFNERGWVVASLAPKTPEEYEQAIRLSRIWINIKFHGAKYNEQVNNKLKKYGLDLSDL